MDMLLGAANAAGVVGAKSETRVDSSVNLTHVINVLGRVYARTAEKFLDADKAQVNDIISECMKDSKLLGLVSKRGKVTDADAVTLVESLKWTAKVMLTGEKPRIRLALIEPSEMAGKNPEAATRQPSVWNALLIEGHTADKYDEVYAYAEQGPKVLNILGQSMDSYEVLLKS